MFDWNFVIILTDSTWSHDGLEGISTSYILDGPEFELWGMQGVFGSTQAVKIISVNQTSSDSMSTGVQSRG
jgi:hypothetical protein